MGACATGTGAVRTGTEGTGLRGTTDGATVAGATTRAVGAGAGTTGRAATLGRGAAGRVLVVGVALDRYCGSATAVAGAYAEGGTATGINGATGSLFLPSFFRNPNIGGRGLIAQFITK
jgi:hypothetical protein